MVYVLDTAQFGVLDMIGIVDKAEKEVLSDLAYMYLQIPYQCDRTSNSKVYTFDQWQRKVTLAFGR